MKLRTYILFCLLIITGLSLLGAVQGPPTALVNNSFIRGTQLTGITRNLLGVNTSNLVAIDPEAVGSTFGGSVAVTGNLTFSTLTGTIVAANLPANLKTGYIPLSMWTSRIIAANAISNTTEAGVPDGNTNPLIERVNGATDKQSRVSWAASNSAELQFEPIALPADCDTSAAITVNMLAAMAGATDTPTVTIGWFSGIGDTTQGGVTAAVTGTTIANYNVSIAASVANTAIKPISIQIIPGTHTTDALRVYSMWVSYTRKS